jgi:peptide/nickel transport system permease protein
MGAGADSSSAWVWDLAHIKYLVLPAATMSVIPMGIITRTVRALVSEMLNKEFVVALRARGLGERAVFLHIAKNVAPTVLAVAGLQVGYLMGGSILVETVFAWPGTGFLLNLAIFQRDMPLLQGIILVLCMFFVVLNLIVDILQPLIDPRMVRV